MFNLVDNILEKNYVKKLMFLSMLFGLIIIVNGSASAQQNCSKNLGDKKVNFDIINKTDKPLIVNFVDYNCKETPSKNQIAPGGTFNAFSYNGNVHRVREVGSNKLLEEISATPSTPSKIIIGQDKSNNVKTNAPVGKQQSTGEVVPNACSKNLDGRQVNIEVANVTGKAFTVNWVDPNCKETTSNQVVQPNEIFKGTSYNGHAFRVREVGTNKLVQEIVANPSEPITIVYGPVSDDEVKQRTAPANSNATSSNPNTGQNACTQNLGSNQIKFEILNATEKAFTVNYVDENCREGRSNQQTQSGQKYTGIAYNGHAFRVREVGTNKLLEVVIVNPSNTFTKVGNVTAATVKIGPKPTLFELVKDPNPMQGFLKTANSVRKARNLPPMEFDKSLNQACQWLTDTMTRHNQMGHNPTAFVGRGTPQYDEYAKMNDPALRMKHYNFQGIPGVEAAGMVETTDVSEIGGSAILQWAMSNTHYRPFLSMDGQEFKYVGFGYTRVPNTNKYYTCAVFGNPSP